MKKSIFYKTNSIAFFVEAIAWLELLCSIIVLSVIIITLHDFPIRFYFLGIIGAAITFVFIYAFGELIQIVHDIRAKLYSNEE